MLDVTGERNSSTSARDVLCRFAASQRLGLVIAALAAAVMLSAVIPPFQSPDEFDHVKRAYGLLSGQILVTTPPGGFPGLWVDDGLLSFMQVYDRLPFRRGTRVNMSMVQDGELFVWSGTTSFSTAAGVGYYLPLVYAPQAIALLAGRTLGWNVANSYRFARLMVTLSCIAIVLVAFTVHPPNFFTLTLLLLPTTLFQMSSASADATTMALAILCASLFMRGADEHASFAPSMAVGLSIAVVILVGCRMNLVALTAMPLFLYFVRRERLYLYLSLACVAVVAAWSFAALSTTSMVRDGVVQPVSTIGWHYLSQPWELVRILWATVSNRVLIETYWQQFVGTLGWLEPRLPRWFYALEIATLAVAFLLSLSATTTKTDRRARWMLILIALTGFLFLFTLLLLTYTPHPATFVMGVQGRYFLLPLLVMSYALHGNTKVLSTGRVYLGYPLLLASALVALYVMTDALLQKYYVTPAVFIQ